MNAQRPWPTVRVELRPDTLDDIHRAFGEPLTNLLIIGETRTGRLQALIPDGSVPGALADNVDDIAHGLRCPGCQHCRG